MRITRRRPGSTRHYPVRNIASTLLVLIAAAMLCRPAPVAPPIPAAAQATPTFNVDTATAACLKTFSPAQRARSDAYFQGSYWLMLWDFLATVIIMLILLESQFSA